MKILQKMIAKSYDSPTIIVTAIAKMCTAVRKMKSKIFFADFRMIFYAKNYISKYCGSHAAPFTGQNG